MAQQDKDLVDSKEEFLKDNLRAQRVDSNGLKNQLPKNKSRAQMLLLLKPQVFEMMIIHEYVNFTLVK